MNATPARPVPIHRPTALQPTSDADRVTDLARCFDAALASPTDDALRDLRTATESLAVAMQAAGLSPERALIALKLLLRGHGGPGWSPSWIGAANGEVSAETRLYQSLFRWWVQAFFRDFR